MEFPHVYHHWRHRTDFAHANCATSAGTEASIDARRLFVTKQSWIKEICRIHKAVRSTLPLTEHLPLTGELELGFLEKHRIRLLC